MTTIQGSKTQPSPPRPRARIWTALDLLILEVGRKLSRELGRSTFVATVTGLGMIACLALGKPPMIGFFAGFFSSLILVAGAAALDG